MEGNGEELLRSRRVEELERRGGGYKIGEMEGRVGKGEQILRR